MKFQVVLNKYATETFRDQADQDYVAARSIYRLHFREQFLWASLQSIEKYLKAILLYNGRSARYKNWPDSKKAEFGHDLEALLCAVQSIEEIGFELPDTVVDFISYVNRYGNNRYFNRPTYTGGEELPKLDASIWYVRRYCQYLHFEVDFPKEGRRDVMAELVADLKRPELIERPCAFRITGGLLERILEKKEEKAARDALVWKNLYYGRRNKGKIVYRFFSGSANPPNVRTWWSGPTLDLKLKEYIKLP